MTGRSDGRGLIRYALVGLALTSGAILAVPTAAILQVLFEELLPAAPTD